MIMSRNKTKSLFLIIVSLIAIPIYISHYSRIYDEADEMNQLTVEGMYLD